MTDVFKDSNPDVSSVLRSKLASALHDEQDPIGVAGSHNVTAHSSPAVSADASSARFTFSPSAGSMMSRRIILEFPVLCSSTDASGVVGGGTRYVFQPTFGPRQYAGMLAIQQATITINNQIVNSLPADFVTAMSRYYLNEERIQEDAEFLSSPDFTDPNTYLPVYNATVPANAGEIPTRLAAQEYKDRAKAPVGINDYSLKYPNRASSHHYTEQGAASGTVSRVYTLRCPLFMNDLLDFMPGRTLANVNKIEIELKFVNNMATVFSCPHLTNSGYAGATDGSMVIDAADPDANAVLPDANHVRLGGFGGIETSAFKLYIDTYESPLAIPPQIAYEYSRYDRSTTVSLGTVGANATVTSQTNSLTLGMIPKNIYVFAKVGTDAVRARDGSNFLRFESLSVNTGTKTVLYNNRQVLREIGLTNGMFCPDLGEYCGVLMLQYGVDLPMPTGPDGAPVFVGAKVDNQIHFDFTVRNTSSFAKNNVRFYMFAEYPMRMLMSRSEASTEQGLTNMEYNKLKAQPMSVHNLGDDADHQQVVGGKLNFKKIAHFAKKQLSSKKIHKRLRQIDRLLEGLDSAVQRGGEVMDHVKAGVDVVQGGQLIGGKMHKVPPRLVYDK